MKKLNKKGITVVEIVVTFVIIMIISTGLLTIIMNYRGKVNIEMKRLELVTFKNTVTKDIQTDINEYGIKEINYNGLCENNTSDYSNCINIVFQNGTEKILAISQINTNDIELLNNKYVKYGDIIYDIEDELPKMIPAGREAKDFQNVYISSDKILSINSVILEDGSEVKFYSIDIHIEHIDYSDDFGIHIVAGTGKNQNVKLLTAEILSNTLITDVPTLSNASRICTTTTTTTGSSSDSGGGTTITTTTCKDDKAGLYSSTNTNDNSITYYFRGNVTNNYVEFAGQIWRIVRINEDGTIRLIMENGINNETTYKYSNTTNDKKYLYYSNSNVKTQLESWYTTNLANHSSRIATGNYFCEELKVAEDSNMVTASGGTAYSSYTPSFKCSTDTNGYGLINSSVGLINYDEVVHAGGYYNIANSNYYLHNDDGFWTMSPTGTYTSDNQIKTKVWNGSSIGSLASTDVDSTYTLRPVINIKANTMVSGSGTSSDPYVVYETKNKLNDTILEDNEIIKDIPNLNTTSYSCVTTTSGSSSSDSIPTTSTNCTEDKAGLYVSTNTNDGSPTYYFRGNVKNNYVSFAGQTWRIVRINEDGTIRLIMQEGIDDNAVGYFNTLYDEYKYVYYTNSNMEGGAKYILDNWYATNIANNSNFSSKVATGEYFCEQAKVSSNTSTIGNANIKAYSSYSPNFKCSTDLNGYGLVNSNIGLLTYDEIVHAGGYYKVGNSRYYLETIYVPQPWWTMSPALFDSNAYVWTNKHSGVSYASSNDEFILRPVINLRADTIIISGDGTLNDKYKIQ